MNRSAQDYREAAHVTTWNIRPFIAGAYRDSLSADGVDNVNPATGRTLCTFAAGAAADVDAAVGAAREAFEAGHWRDAGPLQRKAALHRYCDLLERHADELALRDSLEMGKPIAHAQMDAAVLAPAFARYYAESIDKIYGHTAHSDAASLCFTMLEPRGVVGAIAPWNFPVVNAAIKLFPALAAGNSIVLKPSEYAPSSALRMAELALEAGIPPGVVNVVPGLGPTVGAALAAHDHVDFLSFTGSTATGRALMRLSAGSNGKPLMLECGGKSPCVIFADAAAELDGIARRVVGEAMWNQGQVCVTRSRVLVESSIAPALAERIAAAARELAAGDPLDPDTGFGPLASRMQAQKVLDLIASGRDEGARLLHGGRTVLPETGGCFVEATVFDRVTPAMRLWREEIFGPVVTLTEFTTVDEALALANDTPYGLAATVWARNLVTARRMLRGLKAGEITVHASPAECEGSGFALPQEPRGASGFGTETGLEGLRSYMTIKKVEIHAG